MDPEQRQRLQEAHDKGHIIGLKGVNGEDPVNRLDIDVLLFNYPDTFNLLLIALKELKGEQDVEEAYRVKRTDKMSWAQTAGIHGRLGLPDNNWNGVKERNKDEEGVGYCAHSTPIFSTWHRPYLTMLEQTLYKQAAYVVERFEQSSTLSEAVKQKYREALKNLRLPYWDYFRPRGYHVTMLGLFKDKKTYAPYDYHVPWIFTLPKVMIKTLPDNELKLQDNPFYSYKFSEEDRKAIDWSHVLERDPNNDDGNDNEKDRWFERVKIETFRWGGDEDKMNMNINKIREDNMRLACLMMDDEGKRGYSDFYVFATDGVRKKDDPSVPKHATDLPKLQPPREFHYFNKGSLESFHGSYHVFAGGFYGAGPDRYTCAGHLVSVPISAFDPIFWAHHTQIDRLLAIWQTINPESWFTDEKGDGEEKEYTPLYPFKKEPGVYWDSKASRNTENFGYSYPDIKRGADPAQARAAFSAMYNWSRRLCPTDQFGACPEDMKPLPLDNGQVQVYQYPKDDPLCRKVETIHSVPPEELWEDLPVEQADSSASKVSLEWWVDLVVERMALNNAFTVFFVIGDDTSGSTGAVWAGKPGFAGVSHIFASPRQICENCERQSRDGTLVTATVPISSLLFDYVKRGKASSTEQTDNKPRLASMDRDDVIPFLKKYLKWRVQKVNGEVVNPRVLTENHRFELSVTLRTAPLPGYEGTPEVTLVPEVIREIIANSS